MRLIDNKKGLSTVVATLVIILLVLVAVGIIWVVINNVIEGGAEQIELNTACNNVDFQAVTVSAVSGVPGNYSVTFERGSSGDEIAGLKLTFFNATNDNSGVLDYNQTLDALETQTSEFNAGVLNANELRYTPYFVDDNGNEQLCPQRTQEFVA